MSSIDYNLIRESWKNPGTFTERVFRKKSRAQHWRVLYMFLCFGFFSRNDARWWSQKPHIRVNRSHRGMVSTFIHDLPLNCPWTVPFYPGPSICSGFNHFTSINLLTSLFHGLMLVIDLRYWCQHLYLGDMTNIPKLSPFDFCLQHPSSTSI